MRFASLGSGSRGNATLIESGSTCVMVDCGFSAREAERRLARLGAAPEEIRAVLVTHEHGDHIRGVARFARKHRIPVWMTPGTRRGAGSLEAVDLHLLDCHHAFAIGDLQIQPLPVPHDAGEPSQFVFQDGHFRLAVVTDAGHATPHMEAALARLDALVLECNHDPAMLSAGPYPEFLKRRVGGAFGHLSNAQAAQLLSSLDASRLQHVVASHLSEKNNTPALARQAVCEALDCAAQWIAIADQDTGLGWRQLLA